VVAVLAAATLDPAASGQQAQNDVPQLTHPFGASGAGHVADHLLSPLARWDAVWYLTIAQSGYVGTTAGQPFLPPERRAGFFPGYPIAVRAAAGFSHSPRRLLVAALAVSLVAFLGALWLLYRLAVLEAGLEVGRATAYLLAFSPMALFFSAPYSESLFLLFSIGALYAARQERWAVAGVLAGVASATRNMGVLLIVPLAIMYLFPRGAPRRPLRPNAAFLLLAPVGLVAYSWHLHRAIGDFFGWRHSQETGGFDRRFVGPLAGIKDGVVDAWDSLGHLADAAATLPGLEVNVFALVALAAAVAGTVGVFRELGAAYGAYTLFNLLWVLSAPKTGSTALLSFPRLATVVFPLFIWLAIVCERRAITPQVVAGFAVLLGLFTAQFATWQVVA
jgi:hypothetical protein